MKSKRLRSHVLPVVLGTILFSCLPFSLLAQKKDGTLPDQNQHKKLAPALQQHNASKASAASYRVQVKDRALFLKWLQEQKVSIKATQVAGHEGVLVVNEVSESNLKQLLSCPQVTFIDKPNRKAQVESEFKDADLTFNKINYVHSIYPQINGNNLVASVKEDAFDPDDIDLKNRTLPSPQVSSIQSPHATTMATIIAGAGNSSPLGRGVARNAKLISSDFKELMPESSEQLLANGVSVQNHSYGVGIENYYGIESSAYDKQTYTFPQLLHVFSSGNSGTASAVDNPYTGIVGMANLTGQFKTSKNTLSVGAIEANGQIGARSSKGPTYDGRVKPELVAFGKGGTSEAAALVSGVALLLQQTYRDNHNGALPPAALVKAILINSADDVGRPAVDFDSGFGNTDAKGALKTILDKRFINDAVAQNEEKIFTITVPAGTNELKVTLVWHDPEAESNATKALINDLDLTVLQNSKGLSWQPWVLSSYPHLDSLKLPAKRRPDHLNNVEQVTITAPEAGVYTLKVKGFNIAGGAKDFSLVYEYEQGLEWTYPVQGSSLLPGSINRLRWDGSKQAITGKLEYKPTGTDNWTMISDKIDIATGYYDWQAPEQVQVAQLRLSTGTQSITSGDFILAHELAIKVGYDCDNKLMLFWPKVAGAQQYQVYQLGENYLEPLALTQDTILVADKSQLKSSQFAVAPVLQSIAGSYSSTIASDRVGYTCYIKNFLPRLLVTENVIFDLELSTLHELASISLERADEKGAFQTIKTINPITQLSSELADPSPRLGQNVYRARVVTKANQSYYSQSEKVYFVDEKFVQVAPNPVKSGQDIGILTEADPVTFQLFDQLGRLVRESTETGAVKTLSTQHLPAGLYILRARSEDGKFTSSSRVIIL